MSAVKERKARGDEQTKVTRCLDQFGEAIEASERSLAAAEEKATQLTRKLRRRASVENLAAVIASVRPPAPVSE